MTSARSPDAEIDIRAATPEDHGELAALRARLWPHLTIAEHRAEIETVGETVFLAEAGRLVGFAACSERTEYVNGCDVSPVAFLEGLFVLPEFRRRGVAARLVGAVEAWARDRGLAQLASDTDLANLDSQRVHAALGFEETKRTVFFRKSLAAL